MEEETVLVMVLALMAGFGLGSWIATAFALMRERERADQERIDNTRLARENEGMQHALDDERDENRRLSQEIAKHRETTIVRMAASSMPGNTEG